MDTLFPYSGVAEPPPCPFTVEMDTLFPSPGMAEWQTSPFTHASEKDAVSEGIDDNAHFLYQFYKAHISAVDGNRCVMLPSCSRYALKAMDRHGRFIGSIMAFDRLVRCGRSETRLAYNGTVKHHGRHLTKDAVSDNDFWWQKDRPPPSNRRHENSCNHLLADPTKYGFSPLNPSEKVLIIDADKQFRYAQTLFNHNQLEAAMVECHRFIHFFPLDERQRQAIFILGMTQYGMKRYPQALKSFESLIEKTTNKKKKDNASDQSNYVGYADNAFSSFNALTDSQPLNGADPLHIDAQFMISATYLAMERYARAEAMLQNLLILNTPDPELEQVERQERETEKRINEKTKRQGQIKKGREDRILIADHALYSLAWLYLGRAERHHDSVDGQIKTLQKALHSIERMSPWGMKRYRTLFLEETLQGSIQRLLDEHKDPLLSGILSIIPGGGFAYCRRYHDALASLLINGALVLASMEAFDDGNPALGGLLASIEFGFYTGNVYGGIASAHKANRHLINASLAEFRHRHGDEMKQIPFLPFEIAFHPGPSNSSSIRGLDGATPPDHAIRIPLISVRVPF